MLARMANPPTISLRLVLESPSDPISGSLEDGRGGAEHFFGWTGLAAALQICIDAAELRSPEAHASGEIDGAGATDEPTEDPR